MTEEEKNYEKYKIKRRNMHCFLMGSMFIAGISSFIFYGRNEIGFGALFFSLVYFIDGYWRIK